MKLTVALGFEMVKVWGLFPITTPQAIASRRTTHSRRARRIHLAAISFLVGRGLLPMAAYVLVFWAIWES